MRWIMAVIAATLAACSQTGIDQDMVWARADGQRSQGNPEYVREWELAIAVCDARVAALNVAAPASSSAPTSIWQQPDPVARSMMDFGNAISDLGQAMERQQDLDVVYRGCMAERGYVLIPRPQE